MQSDTGLPSGWEVRHSNSKNLPYYFHTETKDSRWEPPAGTNAEMLKSYMAQHHSVQSVNGSKQVDGEMEGKIRAAHLLIKHKDSRRPSSWKEQNITRSKDEARGVLEGHQRRIQSGDTSLGELATTESDCSSARKRGDLGFFGKGDMQKEFETAAFRLEPGQMSGIVETASGLHLIQRRAFTTSSTHRADEAAERPLNMVSRTITQPKSQGASQAMLYATGMTDADMNKAQVGISSVWLSGNPCNMHLLGLSNKVKDGVLRAGLLGMQFNTIGVSDGISMGTMGMRYSLQSRDLIADSIETVMGGQWYDANISIPGCDKNMPGVIMAMGRINRPSLMVYGGSIAPGCAKTMDNQDIDIVSAFQAYGQFIAGDIDETTRSDVIHNAIPGCGACGGMYTANTMATALETMGMTLPGSSSNPAESKAKQLECLAAGGAIKNLLKEDIRPSDIITRQALENAMVVIMITGGSTNAVLHLIAIADSVGIKLTIDDFQHVSDRIPYLADLKPSGKYVMADLFNVGGTPALLKFLLAEGVISGDGMTVTGKTLKQNCETASSFPSDQNIIHPMDKPLKSTGHLQILYGTLAPGGCVGKITGKEGTRFEGKAKVYDSEDAFIAALESGAIKKGEKTVVVIRYEGPKGGPGMPEMLKPSSAIMGAGLGNDVALITDGRFSGGSHGFLIGHIVPEAQDGGPIGVVRDGDRIVIDAENRKLDLVGVTEQEIERRQKEFVAPPLKYSKGTLFKYAKNVLDASHGCITDR